MSNLSKIIDQGTREGFASNEERKNAYKLVLHLNKTEEEYKNYYTKLDTNLDGTTLHVIGVDVERSLQSLYNDREELVSHRKSFKQILINVFMAEPKLKYYQGFHDVASGFYLVYCNKKKEGERLIYTCSEAVRRILRIYLTEYAHPDAGRMVIEANKLFKLAEEIIPKEVGKIKTNQFGILSFFPILITMGIHRVFEDKTTLRLLDFCVMGGKYAPFYLCCAIVDTTKLAEGESVELGNVQDSDRVLLSGLKYGYRDEGVDEYEYLSNIVDRAAEMIKEVDPSKVFPDNIPVANIIPDDIDIPWEPEEPVEQSDVKTEKKQNKVKLGKDKIIFISLAMVGLVLSVATAVISFKKFFDIKKHIDG